MIKSNLSIDDIKRSVQSLKNASVIVKLNLGRNKFVTFNATVDGVYPSLFTVLPDDKNYLGKTAYSYAEVLCGRVAVKRREQAHG